MPVETTIATIRHAHTRYNAEKRYAGTIDIPLSEAGVQDARRAATKLADQTFDVVITSSQKRSIQTAHILVASSTKFVRNQLCNERNFGIMEGLTWDEVHELEPPVMFVEVGNDTHSVNPKGGEPLEKVWDRAQKFRHFIFKRYTGLRVLVVSHGVFLQMFHGVLRGISCIEALGTYPANLELVRFQFLDGCLTGEKSYKLAQAEAIRW